MSSSFIQLLVLAGVAVFLVLKLRSVLGTREGFEKPSQPAEAVRGPEIMDAEIVEDGVDRDITDHLNAGSPGAEAVAGMKRIEPDFALTPFLSGARQAYEMILMAFERGDLASVRGFLSPEVAQGLDSVIEARRAQGLTIEAQFIGLKEMALEDVQFDPASKEAEVTVRFVGELTSIVRNAAGEIVEGDAKTIKRQRDVWTFARQMGAADPNWQLVATGD